MTFRTILCAGSALTAFAQPASAAQPVTTEPAAPTPSAATPDATTPNPLDILVTARRRSENVQSVPLAISVVDARALEATGSFNVAKLTQLQPSLQFYSTNPRNSAANIRGLGAPFGLTNDGIEQGVGVYIDQVYNSRIAAATFDFLDVEQVEVLRGPQGTLYGKNTTAGAINITTRAPSFEYEGRAEATVGNLGFVQAKASVSGPLIADTLAIRLAASTTERKGTIYNVTSGRRVNEQDNLGFRGSLLWRATDALKLTLSGDYNRQNPECCAQIYVRTGATQRPLNRQFAGLAAALGYAPPSTNAFDRVTDLDTPLDAFQEIGGASLRAEWDVGPGTLTSVSAWRFWNWQPSNDRDFTGLPITTRSNNPSKQDQYSQELRYAVSGDRIDYVAGLFAYHQEQHTTGVQEQGAAASRWLLNPTSANANNPAVLNGLTSSNDILFKSTSLAAFGQVSWKVTDRLKLQPGLRVNYDRKSGNYVSVVTNGQGVAIDCTVIPSTNTILRDQCATLPPQSYNPKFADWNVSGDFTASYEFARDVLGYATYAKSFKSGGINLAGLPLDANNRPILATQTVKPENVNHYELGLKTQLFDRRATFNLAAFWTEIGNYQATVTNGQLGVLRGYLANADKVRVRGIEADFFMRPSERLTVYASGAFTDHEYVKFVDAPCPPELSGGTTVTAGQTPSAPGTPGGLSPANCDISGQWLPGISKWAASYGAEYNIPARFFGREGQVYAAFDGNYRSKFSSNPSRSAYTDIAGYAVANFRAGARVAEGWDVFGWVRNALDKNYYDILATQSGSTGLIVGQPADPRTYGLTVKTRF
ncbi:TonB-dependent receptor [Sphingomonas prati]|uniref:Iron complex outermembrane receptor protein n=1 Tax=Sphingomonas prati TaxID=1843237 RepID=A0A7W9BRA0_9SPHN|nr:TonB-dependent receptor [Sphingomonas prati]MBB5728640.1 iron complex outermembrane receptor protein [Sphingomonas prati]GGE72205.1 TonB-dependent receptor [Sphingomonas prati]